MSDNIWSTTLRDLQPVRCLSKGGAPGGDLLYVVTRVNFGGLFRLKIIPRERRNKADFYREYEAMAALLQGHHRGFSHCYDRNEDDKYYYLLCTYFKGVSLTDHVNSMKSGVDRDQHIIDFTLTVVITLSERVTTLHLLGYCHDGIVSGNILVDEQNNLIIVDFQNVKHYKYQKVPQNFGNRFVMTEQDKTKCLCYQHIGDLAHELIAVAKQPPSFLLSDFIGKLKNGKLNSHVAVLKHAFVTGSKALENTNNDSRDSRIGAENRRQSATGSRSASNSVKYIGPTISDNQHHHKK